MADPVLRILASITFVGRIGRGVFLAVTVLFMTSIVGLSAGEVALVLGVSSAVGVCTAYLGGRLTDRYSARRLLFVLMTAESFALGCYGFATNFAGVLILASLLQALSSAANTVRMAIVAHAFVGEARVQARALLRTVINVAIALGAAVAAIALISDTADSYRIAMIGAGTVNLLGIIPLLKLPSRVDSTAKSSRRATAVPNRPTNCETSRTLTSPFRDRRYLLLTTYSVIFGMQFSLFEVGVPLWIVNNTVVPAALVAILLMLNTAVVIVFQIPLSKGTHDLRKAGKAVGMAGISLAFACVVYSLAAGVPAVPAISLLVLATVAHAFAEVWSQAGTWAMSFELAHEASPGAYQGVFAMGTGIGAMCAPFVVAGTALKFGTTGWIFLALIFIGSSLGIAAIARKASRPSSS
ncbi:MFS transporter [Glutamicibacter sp.]|uniref:MFS transporter n=1 Tax=Glutamicibacter sp. TaxID=1931995 RepID=UPI0028BECD82|nr:MFS transporter [Glutamicibacter sp.]